MSNYGSSYVLAGVTYKANVPTFDTPEAFRDWLAQVKDEAYQRGLNDGWDRGHEDGWDECAEVDAQAAYWLSFDVERGAIGPEWLRLVTT